nr:transketolase C-terminal domain-containing protein [Desulfocurvibacter africanus]
MASRAPSSSLAERSEHAPGGPAPWCRQFVAVGGILAEVIDLRSLVPLDKQAVRESAKKTGQL